MHLLRAVTWRWLTAAMLGGGLLAGGVWYGVARQQPRDVLAQEAPTATPIPVPPAATLTPAPPASGSTAPALTDSTPADSSAVGQGTQAAHVQATPGTTPQAKSQKPQAGPQNANPRRPTGEVTAISQEPASLTMRTATGEDLTFRVLQTTVFAAGRDRPYRFELLKVGDQVTVVGGMNRGQQNRANGANAGAPKPSASPATKPAGATARGQGPRAAARNAQANGEVVARHVMVRPAGEGPRPGAGKKNGGQKTEGQKPAGQQQQTQNANGQNASGQHSSGQAAAGQSQNNGGSNGTGQ